MSWTVRIFRSASGVLIALAMLLPFTGTSLGTLVVQQLRKISMLQTWSMYAPDPMRAHSYLSLRAELADGSVVPLDEAIQADAGWTQILDWEKRRHDIWRVIVVGEKQQIHRSWYLRAVCVREDRARGEPPRRIIAERVRRGFASPAAVLAGKPGLGTVSRTELQALRCDEWSARAMIAADRARRGLAPPPTPPRRGGAR